LGVSFAEAMLVAQRLGGSLPTYRQWLKAVGAMEPDPQLPAGKALAGGPGGAGRRQQLEDRHLALGRSKTLPGRSKEASGDKSVPWDIRQLVSNGREWLDQSNPRDDASRIILSSQLDPEDLAMCFGVGYNDPFVMDLKAMQSPQLYGIAKEGLSI